MMDKLINIVQPGSMTQAMQWPPAQSSPDSPYVIGVLEGEGIGPEIIQASLLMLEMIQACTDYRFDIHFGGNIGLSALTESGAVLTPEVIDFCSSIFSRRGAILCGPGGGRFVYDLRKQFDIFCKFVPIQPLSSLQEVGALKKSYIENVDILVVRENVGGLYQGTYGLEENNGCQQAYHSFSYDENQVKRILTVAIQSSLQRRKKLCVILKPGGAPSISALWRQCAERMTAGKGIACSFLEIDNAVYQVIADAQHFDVIVAPNLFGDIVADCATLLLGSRGLSYSANFGEKDVAVYQTGHGAAYDIAGQNKANPIAQMYSLATMLHESFGLTSLSTQVIAAIDFTLAEGWRTQDIMAPGCRVVGTKELAGLIAANLRARLLPQTRIGPIAESSRHALLLIDVQNDFLDRLSVAGSTMDLVSRIASLLSFCRKQKIPVFHIQTRTNAEGWDRMPHWIKNNYHACIEGTKGALPPDSLSPEDGETIVFKHFFNAFNHTELASALRARRVDTLMMAGLYLHGCIRSTALEAYEQGYTVWVADDAVGSTEPLHAELSRNWLEQRAATFLSVSDIKQRIDNETRLKKSEPREKIIPMANIERQWIAFDQDGPTIINKNPCDVKETRSIVPIADSFTISKVTHSANFAWSVWCKVPLVERMAFLIRWERELHQRSQSLVDLLVDEIGKPLNDAEDEISRALGHINYSISTAQNELENQGDERLRHRPVGCSAIITPWNNPISTPVSKIAPALIFGNTVIWKPAPQAPYVSMAIMDSLIAAGLHDGCVNLLFGDETTARLLIVDPHVKAVSITGSIHTGRRVSALCSRLEKPLQAELGGNNACIVLADVDLEAVIDNLALSAFSFAGQRCTSTRRFIVEQSIANDFEYLFAKAIASLTIGEPKDRRTQIGPVISAAHVLKIQRCIRDAVTQGARIVCGGCIPEKLTKGCWLEPTLLADVAENSVIVQQETFGPVALIQKAIDLADAVRLANGVPHGLLASILTHDESAKVYFAEHIEAGILKLVPGPLRVQPDLPFGGWKASSNGPPEHGEWDRVFYTRPQAIYS